MVEQALEREQALRAEAGDRDPQEDRSAPVRSSASAGQRWRSPSPTSSASRAGVAAELALDPGVVVDRLEVAGAAVGEDRGAAAARRQRPRRARSSANATPPEEAPARIASRSAEPAAADDAVEVGDAHELVELRVPPRGVVSTPAPKPGSEPRSRVPAEERAAPASTATTRVRRRARAGSRRSRAACRSCSSRRTGSRARRRAPRRSRASCRPRGRPGWTRWRTGRARTSWGSLLEQLADELEPRDEQVAGLRRSGLRDDARRRRRARASSRTFVSCARASTTQIRSHAVVAAGLREPDAHVARARLDDRRAGIDEAVVERVGEHRAAGRSLALPPGFAASSLAQAGVSGRAGG